MIIVFIFFKTNNFYTRNEIQQFSDKKKVQLSRFCIKTTNVLLRLAKSKIRACNIKLSKKQVDKFLETALLGPLTETGIFIVTPTTRRDMAGLPKFQRFYIWCWQSTKVGTNFLRCCSIVLLSYDSLVFFRYIKI